MRFGATGLTGQGLARLTLVLAAGSVLAGCSSGATRFADGIVTASTPNQRQIIAPRNQPYPGDLRPVASQQPATSYPDQTYSGTATSLPPVASSVERSSLAPANGSLQTASLPPAEPGRLDTTPTGSVQSPAPATPSSRAVAPGQGSGGAGWSSAAGGSEITVRQGETVYNLSRRFGVPVNAILSANGMSDASQLAAGQRIIIPAYAYSSNAPVSAPDNDRNVAQARSTVGSRNDPQPARGPAPAPQPANNQAVLPSTPQVREREVPATAAAPATPAPGAQSGSAYTVVAGDTLHGIAKKTGARVADIQKANGLSDGMLRIGQKLTIPAASGAVVAAQPQPQAPRVDPTTTSGTPKADRPGAAAQPVAGYTPPRRSVEDVEAETAAVAPEATGVGKMRWPARGRVISNYGSGSGQRNDGIDIAVPQGTPIRAAENGVVIYAGDSLKEFGNTVLVRHEDGLVTVYGHASELNVSRGDRVRRGQEIARSGMSGSAEVPKLHFEVRKDSTPVNPMTYLE